MMTENKYFTPSIEDIRVGYECLIRGGIIGYVEHKCFEESICTSGYKNLIEFYKDSIKNKEIKAPYLTKEQIEAEGWEYSPNYESIEESRFPDELGFLKELKDSTQFLLYYDPTIFQLRIEKIYDCAVQGWVFRGKVKDINTFRYITKLLNIE